MNTITKTLTNLAFGCCLISGGAQAASIQSLTIEEIGVVSGNFAMSAMQNVGGEAAAYLPNGNQFGSTGFVSAGSTDGAIVMGSVQGNNAFTLGYSLAGDLGELNTSRGAPSGSITNGNMTLDLSGLVAEFSGYSFSIAPNTNYNTAVYMIDADHYYYVANWGHVVQNGEVFSLSTGQVYNGFSGWLMLGHLEGVATLVPEAETYAMMLAGLGLVGMMANRRRKLV